MKFAKNSSWMEKSRKLPVSTADVVKWIHIMLDKRNIHLAWLLSITSLLLYPLHLKCEDVSGADVVSIMESSAMKENLKHCLDGPFNPEEITFYFIVNASGDTTLSSTDPVQDQDIFSCFKAAFSLIHFKATGKTLRISYRLTLRTEGAVDSSKNSIPKMPQSRIIYLPGYNKGRALTVAGGALIFGGTAAIITLGIYSLVGIIGCGLSEDPDVECSLNKAFAPTMIMDLSIVVSGIIFLIAGAQKKRRATYVSFGY